MNEQYNKNNDSQNQASEEEQTLNLRDLIRLVLNKWYWFVLSTALCLLLAGLYLMWAPKVYERTASVLIKDNKSKSSETAIFQELAVFEGKGNVNNEMIIFKSISIVSQAVKRLHLDVSYTIREGLRTVELYSKTPVAVSFVNVEDAQSMSFRLKLMPDNEIIITELLIGDEKNEAPIMAHLNDTVNTSAGKIVATPTLWYNDTWTGKTLTVKKSNMRGAISGFMNSLTVALADKQTTVVNLSIKDVSIQRAEDLLNTVIAIYNDDAINDKNIIAVNTENFINERLINVEKELGNVDTKITQYKTSQQLTDIQSDAQLALQESSAADNEILRLQNQRSIAEHIRTYLSDPSNGTDMIPSNTVGDMNVEGQIMNFNQTLLKRNRLIENSSESNPVVQDLNNTLNSLRQSIIRTVDNLLVNLDIQIRSVSARNQRTRARISAVPQQEREVQGIGRERQIKEQLYLYLLNKREENALNKAITESTARIIDPANGSMAPVSPKTMIILLAAIVLGFAIPGVIIYVIMISDITVRNRKDLTSVLSIPFLGEVPFKKKQRGAKTDYVVVKESGRDPVSEAFRIIRTNMDFMRVKQDNIKVITTTSLFVGSGKTFISYNLAASLAMTGKKVLIVDMDIRKGTLGKAVTANKAADANAVGLTSYLSKNVSKVETLIMQDKNIPEIDIILAGPEPPNPAELLLSDRLDELFAELRNMYDYIVIDNVPSGMVADALISNRVADITLYVIRAGRMDRRLLPDIEQLYRDEKLKNMAVVLNAVSADRGYGYDSYGYGYGYGY